MARRHGSRQIQIANESPAGTTSLDCHRRPCAGGHRRYLSLAVFLKKLDLSAWRWPYAIFLPQQHSPHVASDGLFIKHLGLGNRESV
jgi:hypothetical protein